MLTSYKPLKESNTLNELESILDIGHMYKMFGTVIKNLDSTLSKYDNGMHLITYISASVPEAVPEAITILQNPSRKNNFEVVFYFDFTEYINRVPNAEDMFSVVSEAVKKSLPLKVISTPGDYIRNGIVKLHFR